MKTLKAEIMRVHRLQFMGDCLNEGPNPLMIGYPERDLIRFIYLGKAWDASGASLRAFNDKSRSETFMRAAEVRETDRLATENECLKRSVARLQRERDGMEDRLQIVESSMDSQISEAFDRLARRKIGSQVRQVSRHNKKSVRLISSDAKINPTAKIREVEIANGSITVVGRGERGADVVNVFKDEHDIAALAYLLGVVDHRESVVLRARFLKSATYAKIGNIIGVSRDRSRQICITALRSVENSGLAACFQEALPRAR